MACPIAYAGDVTEASAAAADAPGAHVHVDSSGATVTVAEVTGHGLTDEYQDVCMTPCDLLVAPGLRTLRVYDRKVFPATFRYDFADGAPLELRVDPMPKSRKATVVGGLYGGGAALILLGNVGLFGGPPCDFDDFECMNDSGPPAWALPVLGAGFGLAVAGGITMVGWNPKSHIQLVE